MLYITKTNDRTFIIYLYLLYIIMDIYDQFKLKFITNKSGTNSILVYLCINISVSLNKFTGDCRSKEIHCLRTTICFPSNSLFVFTNVQWTLNNGRNIRAYNNQTDLDIPLAILSSLLVIFSNISVELHLY